MQRLIEKIMRKVIDHYAPEEIILFGSYAKQTQHALSDIDMLVVLETQLPRVCRSGEISDFIRQFPVKVDMHFYTPSEIAHARENPHSFISSIMLSGKKIYEKNICKA